jgi:hypothetical protein
MDTKREIERVMSEYPTLNYYGMTPPPERESENFETKRERLANAVGEVEMVLSFLTSIEKGKSINKNHTSYGLKHTVEAFSGEQPNGQPWLYISNGSFIAGALIAGFRVEDTQTANSKFNMLERSITLAIKQIERSK